MAVPIQTYKGSDAVLHVLTNALEELVVSSAIYD